MYAASIRRERRVGRRIETARKLAITFSGNRAIDEHRPRERGADFAGRSPLRGSGSSLEWERR
jgi:hypothetical protein